ncbi:MAG: hypothetical protein KA586_06440 [Candidatus Promineofilum sp.]|nr:hypothetical protein [Promineifilum sp.]
MSDESQATRVVETTARTVTEQVTVATEPVIDWDAAPPATVVETEEEVVTVYSTPPGAWEFTNSQRIVLALLLWLNLLMLVVGYLAVTGQLTI